MKTDKTDKMKTLDQLKLSAAVQLESVYHSWDDLTIEQQNDMWPFIMQEHTDQAIAEYKRKLKEEQHDNGIFSGCHFGYASI